MSNYYPFCKVSFGFIAFVLIVLGCRNVHKNTGDSSNTSVADTVSVSHNQPAYIPDSLEVGHLQLPILLPEYVQYPVSHIFSSSNEPYFPDQPAITKSFRMLHFLGFPILFTVTLVGEKAVVEEKIFNFTPNIKLHYPTCNKIFIGYVHPESKEIDTIYAANPNIRAEPIDCIVNSKPTVIFKKTWLLSKTIYEDFFAETTSSVLYLGNPLPEIPNQNLFDFSLTEYNIYGEYRWLIIKGEGYESSYPYTKIWSIIGDEISTVYNSVYNDR